MTDGGERSYPPSPVTAPTPVGMAPPHRLAQLPSALGGLAGCALPLAGVGAAIAGPAGVAAALAALAVVAVSFSVSAVAVALADRRDPALTLPVALTTYVLKVVVLGLVAFAVAGGSGTSVRWHVAFGVALIAGVLGWLAGQSWWWWRTPRPVVDLSRSPAPAPPHGPGGR